MGWIRVHKINEGIHVQGLEDNLEFDIIIKSISGTQECRKAELRIIGLDNVKSCVFHIIIITICY